MTMWSQLLNFVDFKSMVQNFLSFLFYLFSFFFFFLIYPCLFSFSFFPLSFWFSLTSLRRRHLHRQPLPSMSHESIQACHNNIWFKTGTIISNNIIQSLINLKQPNEGLLQTCRASSRRSWRAQYKWRTRFRSFRKRPRISGRNVWSWNPKLRSWRASSARPPGPATTSTSVPRASADERYDEYLGLPPIAANEPILCLIWEQVASLLSGASLDERSDAAASLVSLARDNDRYGKLIIEGGVPPLLKLLKEGRMDGQENAARKRKREDKGKLGKVRKKKIKKKILNHWFKINKI